MPVRFSLTPRFIEELGDRSSLYCFSCFGVLKLARVIYAFSEKARLEMEADAITELDVAESILNAVAIFKKVRSRSPSRARRGEYPYIIQSANLSGLAIYTKGKLVKEGGQESYYFLVSSKRAM